MELDVFFSICQTDVHGYLPSERVMFENFFEQVELADRLGFGTGVGGREPPSPPKSRSRILMR